VEFTAVVNSVKKTASLLVANIQTPEPVGRDYSETYPGTILPVVTVHMK
jgi:hypothetical protein